jgi:2'-5' RNA ligase
MAESARPWRCFVAVPLSDELRTSLATAVASIRADPTAEAEWRWAEPAAWHLTLAFLGATPPASVPELVERVGEAVSELPCFSVATGGLGAFPSESRARVLWYGVHDHHGRLGDLASRVQAAVGLEDEAFRPHVTLARARDRRGAPATGLLALAVPGGTVTVAGVTMFRSHMGRGPARYEVIDTMPMLTPEAAGALL